MWFLVLLKLYNGCRLDDNMAYVYMMICSFVRFVKGSSPGRGSGFDIDEDDLSELNKYHDVIVASAIFGILNAYKLLCDLSQCSLSF